MGDRGRHISTFFCSFPISLSNSTLKLHDQNAFPLPPLVLCKRKETNSHCPIVTYTVKILVFIFDSTKMRNHIHPRHSGIHKSCSNFTFWLPNIWASKEELSIQVCDFYLIHVNNFNISKSRKCEVFQDLQPPKYNLYSMFFNILVFNSQIKQSASLLKIFK